MPRIVPSQVVELIDQLFPAAKSQKDSKDKRFTLDRHSQNELAAIIDIVEHIPQELIILDTKTYAGLQMAITAIRTTVLNWEHQSHGLELIKNYGNLNPVTIIRNALAQCPDESIDQTTSDLNFISDPDFRKNLRIDISSANQAFINGEWKAATILSGAIIEALLLFVLQPIQEKDLSKITVAINNLVSKNRLKKPSSSNIEDWTLHPLIEVNRELNLIKEETAIQVRLAKDFRNLIHPGVSIRKNQICNRGTALSALAALEHVINDLNSIPP